MIDSGLYGLPPGADFPAELIAGLTARMGTSPPEDWARVEIWVNTRRMHRRLVSLFCAGPPRLLPRIRVIAELGLGPLAGDAAAEAALARRLEIARLVRGLIAADPTLAPRAAAFDLADSLVRLMDEMQGEGVAPSDLAGLDVSHLSAHWTRSLRFIDLVAGFMGDGATDPEARQRRAVEAVARNWLAAPPRHPVIVAGSTGSRGTTAAFMRAVARLPQGAVVLPGVDPHMPRDVWDRLGDPMSGEDHPQFRFRALAEAVGVHPADIRPWTPSRPRDARGALLSLALRPAPVTDQWRRDGPGLPPLVEATEALGLLEAETPRQEAEAIALCMREAVERGRRVALISPDRILGRRVAAALDRWGLVPDDSAGRPVSLSAPGRLVRQVAAMMGAPLGPEAVMALLKHPLVASGADRGAHLKHCRDLEVWMRRNGRTAISPDSLAAWNAAGEDRASWIDWLSAALFALPPLADGPLDTLADRLVKLTELLARGPDGDGSGELWSGPAGDAALGVLRTLASVVEAGGRVTAPDLRQVVDRLLSSEAVRSAVTPRPGLMIWGTLEARVQGADLVILGGLNEGTWPEAPPPDPWLNRPMRHALGLLLPDRQIGLAAHDFQQAVCAPEVLMTRARRDAEAQTVPARWLNLLVNLLSGLDGSGGPAALSAMRERGRRWADLASIEARRTIPAPLAVRPAPCPPVTARPRRLSVTEIQKLIRDPFAIYARHVLKLRPLDPLKPAFDARLRGTLLHAVVEGFVRAGEDPSDPRAAERLIARADDLMAAEIASPVTRALWRATLARAVGPFLDGEERRRAAGRVAALECGGEMALDDPDFVLSGTADRIDRLLDGRYDVMDYKTGALPTDGQMKHFDPQLLLEAAMAEAGAFRELPPAPVARVTHIGLGSRAETRVHALPDPENGLDPALARAKLARLVSAYLDPGKGFAARRAMERMAYEYGYDHLARYGEWSESDGPVTEAVG